MARRNYSNAVTIRGYSAFRRGIRNLDKDLDKQLRDYVKVIAKEVAEDAKRRAPHKSGKLQKSIKASVTQTRASIYSTLPYAPVHEWGGTIRPKGAPIQIEGRHMMMDAVNYKADDVERHMGAMFDAIAKTSGF